MKAKENEEFDKWFKQWISTRTQSRVGVKPGLGEPVADTECLADADSAREMFSVKQEIYQCSAKRSLPF
jgi:hypothetical protein